jgi:hypothetical protein
MKFPTTILLAALLMAASANAQWVTKNYPLLNGWNGVWLAGDASYVTVSELFAGNSAITEIWRWNPNPDSTQFTQTPSEPTANSDEWTIWKRDGTEKGLERMVGNSAYLFRTSGAVTVPIKQLVQPPLATWLISGGNFLGFPAGTTSAPKMGSYFASYPSAGTTVLASPSKIYKYIGGELSANNPMVVATPGSETMDPNKAYWFNVATVGNFTAPVEYEVASSAGLAFGRTLASFSLGITNRSTTDLTLTITLGASEAAPANQAAISGGVPLTIRTYVSGTNSYTETAMGTSITVPVKASNRTTVDFGVDRAAMTGAADAFYASVLRIRDSANLSDVSLPVSALPASPAGLWVMNTSVNQVNPTAGGGSSTSQPFPLLFLAHIDAGGTSRLLSQAFVGKLRSDGNPLGICINEDQVLGYSESDLKPVRYFAAQMPTSVHSIVGTGSLTVGSTASWTIPIAYNEPTNPFVHTYHPDHDNRDAKGNSLAKGQESYDIGRSCNFTFTDSPPDGSYVAGWGSTILGGTYQESITGLHKNTLQVRGTFEMRRVSEVAAIDLTLPD